MSSERLNHDILRMQNLNEIVTETLFKTLLSPLSPGEFFCNCYSALILEEILTGPFFLTSLKLK